MAFLLNGYGQSGGSLRLNAACDSLSVNLEKWIKSGSDTVYNGQTCYLEFETSNGNYTLGGLSVTNLCRNRGTSGPILIEPEDIHVTIADSGGVHYFRYDGSPLQRRFQAYNEPLNKIRIEGKDLGEKIKTAAKARKTAVVSRLQDSLSTLMAAANEYLVRMWRSDSTEPYHYLFLGSVLKDLPTESTLRDSICSAALRYAPEVQSRLPCIVPNDPTGKPLADFLQGLDREDPLHRAFGETSGWVLIDFWASWCGPCIRQQEKMLELKEQLFDSRGVKIIGVSVKDDPAKSRRSHSERKLSWQTYPDKTGKFARAIGVTRIPKYVLVDEAGVIRGVYGGLAAVQDNLEKLK